MNEKEKLLIAGFFFNKILFLGHFLNKKIYRSIVITVIFHPKNEFFGYL